MSSRSRRLNARYAPSVRATVGDQLSVPLRAYRVGAAGEDVDLLDRDGRWAAISGVGSSGVVLVRPDGYVTWRGPTAIDNPASALADALRRILGTPAP